MARFYTWAIAFTYGAVLVSLSSGGSAVRAAEIVVAALGPLSCAAGVVAWAAARDLETDDREGGLVALAESRGASLRLQRTARVLATMGVVARAVALPAIALVVLLGLLEPTPRGAFRLLPLAFGVIGYALSFGVVFGGLARLAPRVSPRHGRALFALVVLCPLVAREAMGGAPGLVSGVSWLLDRVATLSGGTA